ncbi:MAG: hypothetical protein HYT09_00635, partial [Candidatus Levybacteria bacterium]|nr:hypothetical protein [Candidatus Levybacteria bacterium]
MNLFKKLLLFSVIVLFSVVSLASTKDSLAQSVDCKNNTIDNSGDSTYPQDFGTYKLFKLKITNNSNTKCVYTFRGGPVEGWKYGFFKNGQTGPINNTQPLEVAAKGSIFFYVKVTPDEKSLKSPTIQLKIDSANFPGDYEIILYEATDKQVCNARGYECGTVRVGATSLGCGSCPTNQACNTNNKCVQRRDPPTATPTKPKDDNTKCAADLHLKPVSPYPKDNETNRIFSLELKNMSSVTCNFTLEGLLQDSSGWQILFHPFGNEAGTINSSNPLRIAAGKYGQLLVRATPSSAAKNNPKTYHIRIDVNPGGEFEVIEYEIKNPNACGTAA